MSHRLIRSLSLGLLVLAVLARPAAAQNPPAGEDEGRSYGVKGGVLRSNFSYEENQDLFNPETGWMVGAFAHGNRVNTLSWMGELNVLRKSQLCGCNQGQVDLYYLQIPGLLRVNAGAESLNLYGIVGPAVEFKIGEELGSTVIGEYSGVDVSVVAGAGVDVGRFLVEVRGTWGLRNLGTEFETIKITSRTFAILAGFRF